MDGFYWDYDDATRQWSGRFEKAFRGLKPTMTQAGVYSSVLHYLRAVAASGSTDGKVVADKMRDLPIKDPIMRNASIRPDGRVIHDMYLYEVKKPSESKGGWDYSSWWRPSRPPRPSSRWPIRPARWSRSRPRAGRGPGCRARRNDS